MTKNKLSLSILVIITSDLGRYIGSVLVRAYWARLGVSVDTRVTITSSGHATIHMEPGVVVRRGAVLIASDEKAFGEPCYLTVGARTAINESANIRAAGGRICIGSDSLISQFVTIVASGYDLDVRAGVADWQWKKTNTGVNIGDRVWIGAGAIVLPGVTIKDDAVIGAGAIVTRNVPSGEIWVGNPAKSVGCRKDIQSVE